MRNSLSVRSAHQRDVADSTELDRYDGRIIDVRSDKPRAVTIDGERVR